MPTPQEIVDSHSRMVQELKSDNFAIHRVPPDILHAILGISTESGELVDAVKRAIFYDLPFDYVNADEEMGDKSFYSSMYFFFRGISVFDILQQNENKLRARFPEGKFSQDRAVNRDLEGERKVLEQPFNMPYVAPRPSVMWFAQLMEITLRKHDATKGGQKNWRQEQIGALVQYAREELNELDLALKTGTQEAIINEATDVANFVMMIADIVAKYIGVAVED